MAAQSQQDFEKKIQIVVTELKAPKGQFNKFGKYNYRSCEDIVEAVKPLLAAQGLRLQLSDELQQIGDRYYICASANVTDGERVTAATGYAREADEQSGMSAAQITGSASSYARKYALNGLFCIDDTKVDDTNEHREQVKNTPATKPAAPTAEVHTPTEDQLTTLKGLAIQAGYTKEERDEKLAAVTTYQIADQSITKLREMVAEKRQQKEVTAAVTPDNANS